VTVIVWTNNVICSHQCQNLPSLFLSKELPFSLCFAPEYLSTPPQPIYQEMRVFVIAMFLLIGYKVSAENCTQLRDIWDALAGDTTKAVRPGTVGCCGVGGVVLQQPSNRSTNNH
jgi:hypothetical protein